MTIQLCCLKSEFSCAVENQNMAVDLFLEDLDSRSYLMNDDELFQGVTLFSKEW